MINCFLIIVMEDPEVWQAVEAVAGALIERGTLDEEEIEQLIRSSEGLSPPPHARPGAGTRQLSRCRSG